MGVLGDLPQNFFDRIGDFERDGLRSRHHHVSSADIAELEDVADDFGLLVIERARHLALVHDELDFVPGDRGRRLRAAAFEALGDERAQPNRRRGERSDEDLDRAEQPQKPGGPALGRLRRGRFQHLRRYGVHADGRERGDERAPAVDPRRQGAREQHRGDGDSDRAHDEPARFDDGAALDITVECRTWGTLERIAQRGASRSGKLGKRPVGRSVERRDHGG